MYSFFLGPASGKVLTFLVQEPHPWLNQNAEKNPAIFNRPTAPQN